MKVRVTFMVGAASVTEAAAILSQQALYERLVVPRLADLPYVPVAWWLGVAAPVILAATVLGWMARSWLETFATAALGALGLHVYGYWLAQSGRLGWYKSFAVEAPFYYWTMGLIQILLLLAVLASVGHAFRKTRSPS